MPVVATSVRIAGDAFSIVSKLSDKLGQSKAQVIEAALKEMEERIFWADVRDAFARAASEPEEATRQKAEIELWDWTSATDFRDEKW